MNYESENLLSVNNLLFGMFEMLDTTDEKAAADAWDAAADAWNEKGAGRAYVADLWDAANLFALARFSDNAHENLNFEVR